jgi:hypothetical protein
MARRKFPLTTKVYLPTLKKRFYWKIFVHEDNDALCREEGTSNPLAFIRWNRISLDLLATGEYRKNPKPKLGEIHYSLDDLDDGTILHESVHGALHSICAIGIAGHILLRGSPAFGSMDESLARYSEHLFVETKDWIKGFS